MADNFILTPELARAFIAACISAGHRPYVEQSGRWGILLNVGKRTVPEPVHHLPGRCYFLGFDDRPYERMREDPDYIAKLIAATLETEGGAHV